MDCLEDKEQPAIAASSSTTLRIQIRPSLSSHEAVPDNAR